MHLTGAVAKLASQRNDLCNDQLGHTARIAEWRIEDSNTMIGSILKVNLICSDTETANGYKIPSLFQHTSGQLRLRADSDDMDVSDEEELHVSSSRLGRLES